MAANLEQYIYDLPDEGNEMIKTFFQLVFPFYGAHADLADEDLCYSYRKNWNDTAHDDIDFTACGFSTGVVVNTYVKILGFDIKIKLNLELDFDGLVGTASAKGLPIKRIRLNSDIPDDSTYGDSREPLKVTTRK